MIPSVVFFFSQVCFGNSGSFVVSVNFSVVCSSSVSHLVPGILMISV